MSDHPKMKKVLDIFKEVSQIPRCSKNEEQIAQWLVDWAKEHGFEAKTDKVKNVVIKVPASPGYENGDGVILQGHMDMVCEKTKTSTHDFSKDPIKFVYDGDWLKADETTLGADNGIAIAMALALATDEDVSHPAMELLFTVDEETGLTGASELEPGFLDGKILLNVDSEDEGIFTVGCAGGKDTHMWVPFQTTSAPEGSKPFDLVAGGMKGGHSGVDIHEQRANAIHALTRAINSLMADMEVRLQKVEGGTAHNAIPRDAEAVLYLPEPKVDAAKAKIKEVEGHLKSEFEKTDPKLSLTLEPAEVSDQQAMTADDTRKVVDFLAALPHGVDFMSNDIPGLVETSNNLATVRTEGGKVAALTSQRSSVMERMFVLTQKIESVCRLAGGTYETGSGYPSWEPDMSSPILAKCKKIYEDLFDKEPVVEIIHAGLECGIIGSKYPGMDMISFGPTIKNPHSPDEMLELPTVGMVWDFTVELLKSLK